MVLNKSVILTTVTIFRKKRVKFVLLLLNTYITNNPKNRLAEAKSVLTDIYHLCFKATRGKMSSRYKSQSNNKDHALHGYVS